jgi:hypothetical protein
MEIAAPKARLSPSAESPISETLDYIPRISHLDAAGFQFSDFTSRTAWRSGLWLADIVWDTDTGIQSPLFVTWDATSAPVGPSTRLFALRNFFMLSSLKQLVLALQMVDI